MFACCSQPRASATSPGVVRRHRSKGFSFVEILFAVAVLGVGFIMLAAIFPVGLQQTKLTLDETTAAANARGAVATLSALGSPFPNEKNAITQFKGPANSTNDDDYTTVFPHTYAGAWPTVGTLPGQVPPGQSRTFYGQLRSLRDGRNFCDRWNPAINDPPRPVVAARADMAPADVVARRNTIWSRVSSELLTKSNDRNAFVVLYKRDVTFSAPTNASAGSPADLPKPAENAQIVVINAQVSTQSAYTDADVLSGGAVIRNLEPRPVGVTITYDNVASAYVARFSSVKGAAASPPVGDHEAFSNSSAYDAASNQGSGAVAEGAYIVISDDNITTAGSNGRMNGRIYKLGNYRTDLSPNAPGFELAPGYGFTIDGGADGVLHNTTAASGKPGFNKDDITALGVTGSLPDNGGNTGNGNDLTSSGPAVAYVLGKGFDNVSVTPGTGASGYAGTAQDVAIYTTFIPVK